MMLNLDLPALDNLGLILGVCLPLLTLAVLSAVALVVRVAWKAVTRND